VRLRRLRTRRLHPTDLGRTARALRAIGDLLQGQRKSPMDAYLEGWLDAAQTHERLVCVCLVMAWLRDVGTRELQPCTWCGGCLPL
jgi:hypothetical protein